jgi:hypothetical protein
VFDDFLFSEFVDLGASFYFYCSIFLDLESVQHNVVIIGKV